MRSTGNNSVRMHCYGTTLDNNLARKGFFVSLFINNTILFVFRQGCDTTVHTLFHPTFILSVSFSLYTHGPG